MYMGSQVVLDDKRGEDGDTARPSQSQGKHKR
jgi:hypothetical protein